MGNLVLKACVHAHSYKQLLRCHLSDEFKGKIMRESSRHPGWCLESVGRVRTPRSDLAVNTIVIWSQSATRVGSLLKSECYLILKTLVWTLLWTDLNKCPPQSTLITDQCMVPFMSLREPVSLLGLSTGTGDGEVATAKSLHSTSFPLAAECPLQSAFHLLCMHSSTSGDHQVTYN